MAGGECEDGGESGECIVDERTTAVVIRSRRLLAGLIQKSKDV